MKNLLMKILSFFKTEEPIKPAKMAAPSQPKETSKPVKSEESPVKRQKNHRASTVAPSTKSAIKKTALKRKPTSK